MTACFKRDTIGVYFLTIPTWIFFNLFGHLVWPVTVLILAWMFRVSIAKLLLRLRRLKGKGWEFEFGKELAELTEEAEEAQLLPSR